MTLSEHEAKQLDETLEGVQELRMTVAVLATNVANNLKLQDELRGDLYGGDGRGGIKGRVQALDDRWPSGIWLFFCPIVQNWITWAVIAATAAVVYLTFLHPVVTAGLAK